LVDTRQGRADTLFASETGSQPRKPAKVTVDDEDMLLWVLRYDLGLTGAKFGCGEGICGACRVIVRAV